MAPKMEKHLKDSVVLVTRPLHQQAEFIQMLQQQGATGLSFPSIEIQPVKITDQLIDTLNKLNQFDLLIFVSVNAVNFLTAIMARENLSIDPDAISVAVIGAATLKAASEKGIKVDYLPETGFNSEALLKLPDMQADMVKSRRVLIVRGKGGLEELASRLKERGASVEYAEVYQRNIPQQDNGIKRQQLNEKWSEFGINVITVTSNEALQNLYDMLKLPARNKMLKTTLVVPSERGNKLARSLGFESVVIAESATNRKMLEAITKLS